jgi:hypothetical protein
MDFTNNFPTTELPITDNCYFLDFEARQCNYKVIGISSEDSSLVGRLILFRLLETGNTRDVV